MLDDWNYNNSPWLSSSMFILGGIVASGLVLVVLTRLVSHETRHLHNEFMLFTVTNMAVLYAVLLAFIAIAAWEDLSKASEVVGNRGEPRQRPLFRRRGAQRQGGGSRTAGSFAALSPHCHRPRVAIAASRPSILCGRTGITPYQEDVGGVRAQ
jgi:hypothetical protein